MNATKQIAVIGYDPLGREVTHILLDRAPRCNLNGSFGRHC